MTPEDALLAALEAAKAAAEEDFSVGLVVSIDEVDAQGAKAVVNERLVAQVIALRGGSPFAQVEEGAVAAAARRCWADGAWWEASSGGRCWSDGRWQEVASAQGEARFAECLLGVSISHSDNIQHTQLTTLTKDSPRTVQASGGSHSGLLLRELKRALCPVVVSVEGSAMSDSEKGGMERVVSAVQLGAARLRRLYSAHKDPGMLEYLAARRVPLQLQLDVFRNAAADEADGWWAGASPLNFLLMQHVNLVISSGAKAVHVLKHLDALAHALQTAKLPLPATLMLLGASFEHSFLPYQRRRELLLRFWARAFDVFPSRMVPVELGEDTPQNMYRCNLGAQTCPPASTPR